MNGSAGILRAAVEATLGQSVVQMSVVRGGDVAASFAVDLDDERRVFAKTHPSAPPGFFTTEAAGLRWLHDAHAVLVPKVIAVADQPVPMLVLEWIEGGRASASTEADLGIALAGLHATGAPC
ncbi:MAG: fructosamine kinase family protein, partial [Ilumatobacteraceae bacterium]